jgi:hypothetical protein
LANEVCVLADETQSWVRNKDQSGAVCDILVDTALPALLQADRRAGEEVALEYSAQVMDREDEEQKSRKRVASPSRKEHWKAMGVVRPERYYQIPDREAERS